MSETDDSVTGLLCAWRKGDDSALARLTPLLYSELRSVAARLMRREHPGHTLQPTALVHEAYLKLLHNRDHDFAGKAHFLAVAARNMRQILVDHARKRRRLRRGSGLAPVTLHPEAAASAAPQVDLLALDEALSALAAFDERKANILEMHFFGGMSHEEIALVAGVHPNTVARDLHLARAWLQVRLSP